MSNSIENQLSDLSCEKLLKKFFTFAQDKKIAVAAYSLPKSGKIQLLAGPYETLELESASIETLNSGFLISPFFNAGEIQFIKSSVLIALNEKKVSPNSDPELLGQILSYNSIQNFNEQLVYSINESGDYSNLVKLAKERIQSETFKKVVLSRCKIIENISISPENIFFRLTEKYPESFVSMIFHPSFGLWVGASPELLSSLNKEKKFETIALAGTQKLESGKSVSEAVWGQKEIEEQALVSRYIINSFKSVRLREFEEEGPKTVVSGNLLHLKTRFSVNNSDKNYPRLTSRMLNLLHPTSAVGGMPRKEALSFIQDNEQLDRQLFAGFLGPVNIGEEIHLFVNIRCARLSNNSALLFAGAGITEDSDPEKEYLETELKMEAIGNILKMSS